jgi:hypothetical protein
MIQGTVRTEKEYRKLPVDSSSSLKEFSLDRKKYYKKYVLNEKVEDEDSDSKASITGRIVETLLFEKEKFDDKFYLSSVTSAPTGNMLLFVDSLYKHTEAAATEDGTLTRAFEDIAKDAYKDSGYKWSFEKVLEKFSGSSAEIYYQELRNVKSKGLTVVTADDVNNGERVVEELRINEATAPIVNLVSSDRYTVLIQHQIDGYKIDGLEMKSMIDLIIIDHKEKTIYIYDLKCSWSVEGFLREYYLYRRAYIQAYVYYKAGEYLKGQLGLNDYKVEYPKFIVCDSINYVSPLIYTLNSDDIQDAYMGFFFEGKRYPGVKSIVMDMVWARENNQWRISRKNYLSGGIVNIKE